MLLQYIYLHTCGHTGIGPITRTYAPYTYYPPQHQTQAPILQSILQPLPHRCPFCAPSSTSSPTNIPLGHGILALYITSASSSAWHTLRVCKAEDITPSEWMLAHDSQGMYRHTAWIPRPCGRVSIIPYGQEVGERSAVTEVTCAWRQRGGGRWAESRFAGLLSQLNAAIQSGVHAGRYEDMIENN